jgi:hypothetical protein
VKASIAALACACVLGACNGEPSALRSAEPDAFRALVYARGFAERFKLPPKSAMSLEAGVLAIAITVQQRADGCSLLLYLDESVPFAYPPGREGRMEDLHPQTGPLFFASDMSEADARAMINRVGDLRVIYQSRTYGTGSKRGVMQGGGVSAFWRGLLPGLNILRFDVACRVLDPEVAPVDLWLLRDGSGEMPATPNEQVAFRVAIPESLLRESAVASKRAAKVPIEVRPQSPPAYSVPPPVGSVPSNR